VNHAHFSQWHIIKAGRALPFDLIKQCGSTEPGSWVPHMKNAKYSKTKREKERNTKFQLCTNKEKTSLTQKKEPHQHLQFS
jgi:hypothetical protein